MKVIEINQFQLNALFNDKEKKDFKFLLNEGVFCSTCRSLCKGGIKFSKIILNSMNDVVVKGTCNTCGGKVVRVMEFGEDPEFYKKADVYRKSI